MRSGLARLTVAGALLFSGAAAADTIFAQKLIDDAKAARSDIVTIGIHAKAPGSSQYTIVAHTNRQSVGHESEGADLVTLKTGKPDGPNALADGVYDVGVPLKDRTGKQIGFLAVHIRPPAQSGDPKEVALRSAFQVRDELASRIASASGLFEAVD
jgi:hypothetical protein